MPVQLICCSHSPLMTTDVEESEANVHAAFFNELDSCAAALRAFDPDLVVVFGPDHFNGFFYELMPAFCIGTAAEGTKDWHLESGPLRVPRETAMACVRHLQSRDFDVAISHQMKVDHGITIPLYKLTGALARYQALPVFINCAADPRPSFRRVRAFGEAMGEFLAGLDMRVTLVGSGGLSHDPPTPRLDQSPPEVARRLIVRATPSQDELDARESRVIKAARDLVVGKGPCLPPSEQWDRAFLDAFLAGRLERFDAMSDDEIDRVAGFGAHEVRTWVAAAAAARRMGKLETELRYYHLVPEWITGMGIVVGQRLMRADIARLDTIASGDVTIAFRRFGAPGRAPVLIVHGLSYFSYDWIGPATRLAVDREVVAIDMRGFGASSWSPARDYKLETLSADAVAVMDALGWQHAVLMGHSFGGRVALATAGWTPERAAGVVLVDFAPDLAAAGRRHTAERIGGQPDVFDSVDAALAYHGHHDVPAGAPVRARYEAFLERIQGGYRLRRDLAFRDNFRRALESGQSAPVPAFLWPMLAGLKVPLLVIRASESDMFAPETLDKVRAENPRATALEIAGSHDLAGDNPDALVVAVRSFLDGNAL